MAERRPIPPLHQMMERAVQEVPLYGATPSEIRSLHPMGQTGVEALGHRLDEVERVCLFIGHPRSGHSLVGAMLDAHPDLCIAHELDMLAFLREEAAETEAALEAPVSRTALASELGDLLFNTLLAIEVISRDHPPCEEEQGGEEEI